MRWARARGGIPPHRSQAEGVAPMNALARLCRRLSNRSLTLAALSGLAAAGTRLDRVWSGLWALERRGSDVERFGDEVEGLGTEGSRFGIDVSRFGTEANRLGIDVSRFGTEGNGFAIDA